MLNKFGEDMFRKLMYKKWFNKVRKDSNYILEVPDKYKDYHSLQQ